MPKKIINDWSGGLSKTDKNAPENTYFEGRGIDPERTPGYLGPGFAASVITKSDDNPQIIDDLIIDILPDAPNNKCYFLDQSDHLYQMSSLLAQTWNSDFDGGGNYYKDITGATRCEGLALYNIGATKYLFYFYQDDFGRFDLGSTFDDDWGSTIPAGAVSLQDAPHPPLEWQTFLWIPNGRYLAKLDGQTGANGTLTPQALDLGANWEISKLFRTKNYIGICAYKTQYSTSGLFRTESKLVFYDGVSEKAAFEIPTSSTIVDNAYNDNGTIYVFSSGTNRASRLSVLQENGLEDIRVLEFPIDGTTKYFSSPKANAVDVFRNRITFGKSSANSAFDYLMSHGRSFSGGISFTMPFIPTGTTTSHVGAIKATDNTRLMVGYTDGTLFYLGDFATGNSTAHYKSNTIDFGQKVRINYIKYYFKPLASGDTVTPTISLDAETAVSLDDPNGVGTIAFANDGAITSKRFNVMRDCHSLNLILDWTAAAATIFSKIVIDYDFLPDDN